MHVWTLFIILIWRFIIVIPEHDDADCPPLPPPSVQLGTKCLWTTAGDAGCPSSSVQLGTKCLWTTAGGNMSTAAESCQDQGGFVLSFDDITWATQALVALNISLEMPVYISAIRNDMNGSRYYDWLNRPGSWSPGLDKLVTPLPDEDDDDPICLRVTNETLVPTECNCSMSVTVCEKDIQALSLGNGSIPFKSESALLNHVLSRVVNTSRETTEPPAHGDGQELILIPKDNGTMMISFENLLELVENKSRSSNDTDDKDQSSICTNQTASEINNGTEGNPHTVGDGTETTMCTNQNSSTIAANETERKRSSEVGSEIDGSSNNNSALCANQNSSSVANETGSNGKPTERTATSHTGTGRPSFISGLFHRNHTPPLGYNETGGALVKEVPFQVSGLGIGTGPTPYPPLFVPDHVVMGSPEFIKNISDSLSDLQQKTSVSDQDFKTFTKTFHRAVENDQMKTESVEMRKSLFMDILMVAEQLVGNVENPAENISLHTDAIDISSVLIAALPGNGTRVDVSGNSPGMTVNLSASMFGNCSSTGMRVSTIVCKKTAPLAEASSRHISSTVMSVSIQTVTGNTTSNIDVSAKNAIVFTMETFVEKRRTENNRECAFLNFSSKAWSTSGCRVTSQNSSHTTCSCDHLTSFAILVMYVESDNISLENQQVLFTLTTVGCSLSIACLVMTLITYVYLKMLGREKIMIHANLSLALMLAQLVFVASADAHKHKHVCKAIAITLHFLFMSAFTWTLVEGVALYLCCTRGIFNQRDMRGRYFLLGWGLPALIVVISVAAEFPDYGNGPQYSCWLSVHNGLIWAFIGPMIAIVLLNMLVMGLVVKVFLTLKTNTQKTEVARFRGSVRAMMTLLPLLGLTWGTSLLVPFSVVFHYLFTITNTVQGMCIFFFHCICNDEIRQRFREKTRRWSSSRTGSEADVSHQHRRKRGSFDALKATGGVAASPSPTNSGQRNAWT